MDFFKSVFSDDPEPSDSPTPPTSPPNLESEDSNSASSSNPNTTPKVSTITNAWTFGSSLFKTIASKSESVMETYRRDLEEFSSGLKKETATIREVASRAVKDLPSRLETGAAVAQEKLESVGEAIDNIGMTMTEIIAQGKDSILADNSDSELYETNQIGSNQQSLNSIARPYSRFDAQIRAIQCDLKTYCEEPEDVEEYNDWKSGFLLDEKAEEIEDLIEENGVIEEIHNEVVPGKVDREAFWCRYFYKVHKVKKAEEARAKLVNRAISGQEEELSWDVDDDDYEESDVSKPKDDLKREIEGKDSSEMIVGKSEVEPEEKIGRSEVEPEEKMGKSEVVPEENIGKSKVEPEEKNLKREYFDNVVVSESQDGANVDEKRTSDGRLDEPESCDDKIGVKSEEKITAEGKVDGGSCKDSDFSVVSSQPSSHEEDLEWDEIEDVGNSDEIKVTAHRADLRKRLSAAEEDEDLTWDIEDDDEPAKS